jgi:hypothetical protein
LGNAKPILYGIGDAYNREGGAVLNTTSIAIGVGALVAVAAALISWRRRKFNASDHLGVVSDQWMAELKLSRDDPQR